MKKLAAKVRKIKMTRWSKLTLGEEVASIIMKLVKVTVIVAIIALVVSMAIAIAAGVVIAFGITSAIAGGFKDASQAYRPGDRYVRFR